MKCGGCREAGKVCDKFCGVTGEATERSLLDIAENSADFLVAGKKLIEVKPVKLFSSPTVRIKQEAAIDFCIQNGLTYEIVDSPMLSDAEITKLYVDGTIQFTERYEKKFLERNPHVKVADFGGANSVGQEFLLQKCGETRHYLYER
jgi:hypothetical protein